jgi:hypothetical protein
MRHDSVDSLNCVRNGAADAAHFASDVQAARMLAATLPPAAPAAPDSRAAEELALRLQWTDLGNNGCASCGGFEIRNRDLPITFYATPTIPPGYSTPFDGDMDGVYFIATYVAGKGWHVQLNAC